MSVLLDGEFVAGEDLDQAADAGLLGAGGALVLLAVVAGEIDGALGSEEEIVGEVAGEVLTVREAIEDEVVLLLARLVVEAVEEAAVEEGNPVCELQPPVRIAKGVLVAPEVGDAVVLVVALAVLLLLAEAALVGRHVERAKEEVLEDGVVVGGRRVGLLGVARGGEVLQE